MDRQGGRQGDRRGDLSQHHQSARGASWASEDQALAEIGKLVGDEFSKNFFLQHFNFGAQPIRLKVAGLPDARSAQLVLRELRGIRQVLDAQLLGDPGTFQLQLPEGSATDIVQDAILKPLNAKLGQNCFALAGASGAEVNVSFSAACAEEAVRARLETAPPAGLYQRRGSPQQGAAQGHGLEDHLEAAFAPGERPGVQPRTTKSTVSSLDSAMLWPNVMRPWLRSITSSRRRAISASPANVTKVPLVL